MGEDKSKAVKPKKALEFSDSESDDGVDDTKANLVIDSDQEQESDVSDIEVNDRSAEAMEAFELPEGTEEAEEPGVVKKRIEEMLGVLNNFRGSKTTNPRSDIVVQLVKDCASYYGYLPQLIELFLTLFSPNELSEFLQANEEARPVVIRTNTLKTRRRELAQTLTARGMNLEPLAEWTKVGLKVFESTVPVGATPEYLAGHYMLQSASSFMPVIALGAKPGERILDMASAPGGKTSYIAQMMKNKGLIVANDANKTRIQSTISNLARLGVHNTIHCSHDGREFPKVVGGFHRVLLDAPCSGLGVIARDPTVKLQRTIEDIRSTAKLQKELLLSAIDSCDHKAKDAGIIVYSTCSISVEENEEVVQYALQNRDVRIVETGLPFGKPGLIHYKSHRFHPSLKHTRRFYPHIHNVDGFYVAKLQKTGPKKESQVSVSFGKVKKKKKQATVASEETEKKQEQKKRKIAEAEGADKQSEESSQKKTQKQGKKKKVKKTSDKKVEKTVVKSVEDEVEKKEEQKVEKKIKKVKKTTGKKMKKTVDKKSKKAVDKKLKKKKVAK